MKLAIIQIDHELLRQALHLPDDVQIERVQSTFNPLDVAEIRLSADRFADVPAGHLIPKLQAVYQLVDGKPKFIGFK